jgi:hypothetical protein
VPRLEKVFQNANATSCCYANVIFFLAVQMLVAMQIIMLMLAAMESANYNANA